MQENRLLTLKQQNFVFGFTIIEIMIVIAIVGILTAIGIPSIKKYLANSRAKELAYAIAGTFHRANTEARTQSTWIQVCGLQSPIPAGQTCKTFNCSCGNSANWANGWMIINAYTNVPIYVNNTQTPANTILTTIPAAGGQFVTYTPNGMMQNATSTFTIKPPGCSIGYTVTVLFPLGQVKICGPNTPGCTAPTCP